MNLFLLRLAQRLLVLAFGATTIYVAVWQVLPLFDKRVPLALALFITYVVMAYGILPAATRVFRLFYQPNHIPLYCVTPDGLASDPINIGIVGTRIQIIQAMEKAGWYLADRRTPHTMTKTILFFLLRRSYPNAPFSTLFLFGRRQDLGFEQEIEDRPGNRHHVRFWACHLQGPEEFHQDVRFWRRLHRPLVRTPARQLWVGAASKDIGLAPVRHNAQITHMIHPDTNAERDLIVRDLKRVKAVGQTRTVTVGRPYSLRNRAFRGILNADGKLAICELKAADH